MPQREGASKVPVLPVRDLVLFPGIIVPLFVGRPRSLKALEEAMLGDKTVFVVAQKEISSEDPGSEDFYDVGTLCQVIQMVRVPDGTTKALVEGLARGKVVEYFQGGPYFNAAVEPLALLGEEDLPEEDAASLEPMRRSVLASFERYATLHPKIPGEVIMSVHSIEDPHQLADIVASHLLVRVQDKQKLLEILDPLLRLEELFKLLLGEIEILELEHDIHDRVRQEMEKNNREYYLKEQLRVIQDELGQGNVPPEIGEYRKKIETSRMPKSVEERALKELERLMKMPSMSAEATVARTYLDWLVELPWQKSSRDRLDIQSAEQVLEEDHYGMEKIKERVLEFLAVRKHAGKDGGRGQVLCFVGPPGVGKTSLGRSIARALGRKFVNISLGGMRDEAEIRGHRRTYVGALPGRIIQKIRTSGTKNPVMLLDEIDKIGSDFRGDPAAALLEVLDPEQNASFTDHFLEIPFDLSKVLFLTTANVTHTIPRALVDRMEIIHLPGYVQEEKVHIAQRHLWPKVCGDHGLQRDQIALSTPALEHIIQDYTREAGVRNLERQLAKLARKITRNLVELTEKGTAEPERIVVNVTGLKKYLGPPMVRDMRIPSEDAIGTVVGLAWTESGGDTLVVETMIIKGKGNVLLTGNLGNIMQESAKTALGHIRGTYVSENVEWDKTDVHVHVPEGAIPKDGPSAGITLAVAMLSSIKKIPVRNDLAMTGEITLRGNVLPIGGVREKILAAKRQDIRDVLIPEGNKSDVEELPRWVLSGITVHYVRHLDDVLRHAFRNLPA